MQALPLLNDECGHIIYFAHDRIVHTYTIVTSVRASMKRKGLATTFDPKRHI